MRPDATQNVWQCAERGREREGLASDHFTGASRMFGHNPVLHKHHWSLNPPLPPRQDQLTVLVQTKYMDVYVLVFLSVCALQQTSIYP